MTTEAPAPRLLACYTCKTLIPLPPFEGPSEMDFALDAVVQKHQQPEPHKGMLFSLDVSQFDRSQLDADHERIIEDWIKEVRQSLLRTGHPMQELRDELREDAMVCFNKHGRPQSGCIDYKDDSKLLSNKHVAPKYRRHLCELCPVQSYVTISIRSRRGDYSK